MMAYDYSRYGNVLVGRQDKVLIMTLNSPETLNAFTGPMHTSMSRIWDDVNDDPDVHVVVLTGAGRAFSASGNVIAMQKKIDDPDAWDAGMPEARRIVFSMLECDKPIIARVNGHAVGLGAMMPCFATSSSRLTMPRSVIRMSMPASWQVTAAR
jgi:enoyl-CoA hydratase/carnithine racemase